MGAPLSLGWYEGREFVLDISCPYCKAPVGTPCFTRHGAEALRGHWSRFEAALRALDRKREREARQ